MLPTLRFRASEYAGDLRHAPHAHDHLQVSLMLRGRLRESVGGAEAAAGALSVVVKDAGVVHEDLFGPEGVAIAQLSLPGGCLRDIIDTGDRAPGWFWSHSSTIARPFLRIVTRASTGEDSFSSDDTDVVDLPALVAARHDREAHGAPPRWLADAVDELHETWSAGTRVSDVAARIGVHPVYLARCFRRWYGHGVSDHLRFLRQRASVTTMIASDATLSTIAHSAGYADEPHLNRDLLALSGLPPSRLRRALRQFERASRGAFPVRATGFRRFKSGGG